MPGSSLPTWWLALSAVFFLVNIVFFGVLVYALIKLLEVAKGVQPKVNGILARVDSIGEKVDELTATVKDVAAKIGERAEGVASSASQISHVAAHQVEKYGPILAAAATAAKVVSAAREIFLGLRGIPKKRR